MKKSLSICALAMLAAALHAQSGEPDLAVIKSHMEFLCNDECAGRKTCTEGERAAGNYIAKYFQELGLEPAKAEGFGGATPYHLPWSYGGRDLPPQELIGLNEDWWMSFAYDRPATSYNICGVLPGTDPELKKEYVLLIAHYDHMGKTASGIIRGADDNASGTTGIMEIARLFKENPTRRSLAFIAFSGEEQQMLGSKAYVRKPAIPLSATKAVINLDMISRQAKDMLHIIISKTDGLISTLTRDGREICNKYGFNPSCGMEKYAKIGDSGMFAVKGIPSIWFNSGMHTDYHKTADNLKKTDYEKMQKIIQITRDLTSKVGNDDKAPVILPRSEWSKWKWGPYSKGREECRETPVLWGPAED